MTSEGKTKTENLKADIVVIGGGVLVWRQRRRLPKMGAKVS